MIKNLALRGAGVCGQAYTGAVLELDKRGLISGLERVAGTSAGSIVALLLSMKCNPKEIFDISAQTDFRDFMDGNLLDKTKVFSNYGIHPGKSILEWIEGLVIKSGFDKGATFADFKKAGCLDLNVFATDLNSQGLKQFCYELTPNHPVAECVRASISIPYIFNAYQFKNTELDDHIYVDGGVVYNYPLTVFDGDEENTETLGLYIGLLRDNSNSGLKYGKFVKFNEALVNSMLNSQTANLLKSQEDLKRTIVISNCGVSATNFNVTTEDKMMLFESGRKAVVDYFKIFKA